MVALVKTMVFVSISLITQKEMINTNANAENHFLVDIVSDGEMGRINLTNTLLDLFFAGSETTSSTLTWGILYLILNPDKQVSELAKIRKKVQSI